MKRKLEEKILEEIRKIVIEKDLKRQSENEKEEMREANIEALTELTSLSREEVEDISADVRKVFLTQHKKKQKRNTRIAIGVGIAAIIAFFIFKPEKELVARPFTDDFSENKNNWSIYNDFTQKRYFKNNQYIYEIKKDDWCYWDNAEIEFPENFDVEVNSNWIKGKYDGYGVALAKDNTNYLAFRIKADGKASFAKIIEKEWVISGTWLADKANKGKNQTNIQKIKVRDKKFKYFVNDNLVRTGVIDMQLNNVALRACGNQVVAFNSVKVTDADKNEVIFEDDFSNPDERWETDKDYEMDSYFQDGQFILDSNDENGNCHWANSSVQVTENCELILSSVWHEGELDTYGFMVMNDDDNYYSFELKNDGNARLVERKYGAYDYVQTYLTTSFESDGYKTIDQKLVVENGKFSYFVNDVLIEEYEPEISFPANLGLRICGKQKVAFEHLDIKYYE